MFNNIPRWEEKSRKAGFAFCPCGNSGCSSCTSETLNAASVQSHAEFLETQFFVLILFIKLSNILAEKINAASVKQVPLLCFHCNNTELD